MSKDKTKKVKVPFRIADKKPYLGVVLELLWGLLIVSLSAQIIGIIITGIFNLPEFFSEQNVNVFFGILIAIILLYYHRKKRMGEGFGGYYCSTCNKLGLKLMIVFVAYWIVGTINVAIFSKLGMINAQVVLMSLGAGVMEETMFRIIPLTFAMRHREKKNFIVYSVIATSVIFGAVHVGNYFVGAPLDISIFQGIATTFIGLLFAAIYLRTGNILFIVGSHFINDVISGFDAGALSDNLVYTAGIQPYNYIDLAMVLVMAGIAIYLIRPSKHSEIIELWDGILQKE